MSFSRLEEKIIRCDKCKDIQFQKPNTRRPLRDYLDDNPPIRDIPNPNLVDGYCENCIKKFGGGTLLIIEIEPKNSNIICSDDDYCYPITRRFLKEVTTVIESMLYPLDKDTLERMLRKAVEESISFINNKNWNPISIEERRMRSFVFQLTRSVKGSNEIKDILEKYKSEYMELQKKILSDFAGYSDESVLFVHLKHEEYLDSDFDWTKDSLSNIAEGYNTFKYYILADSTLDAHISKKIKPIASSILEMSDEIDSILESTIFDVKVFLDAAGCNLGYL